MSLHLQPVKGRWYHDLDAKRDFQVTWVDEDQTLVEACFEDGHNEQFPLAAWHDLNLELRPNAASNDKRRRWSDWSDWSDKSPDDFPEG